MKLTRFPPEPNGRLHLGHLKAMLFDFGPDCDCILRLDDTNPKSESQEYVNAIIEDVQWLGFHPSSITYTSDYFDILLQFAIKLIRKGKAYVDFTPRDVMREERHNGLDSKYRDTSIDDNLLEFEKMKQGLYDENQAVLRLKINMIHDNHSLRDPIAYRIIHGTHYRTGTKYHIYPSYDYSHGIVDSLENRTHSYCTMEFYVRRELYAWSLQELDLPMVQVIEFGRLNIEKIELSKRKIFPLIEAGVVLGFDDPRLYTIAGLRRRGFTPEILKSIVQHTVTSDTGLRHDSLITQGLIDHELRQVLNVKSPRAFAVINPLKVEIIDQNKDQICLHPNFPDGSQAHETCLTPTIYIERSDFKPIDELKYYRLAPGKTIRLRYADFVEYVRHDQDLIMVKNTIPNNAKKIKGIIHWVSENSPLAYFELYGKLGDPVVTYTGRVEQFVMDYVKGQPHTIFQFERLGYFKLDRYLDNIPVFIQVIDLVDKFTSNK